MEAEWQPVDMDMDAGIVDDTVDFEAGDLDIKVAADAEGQDGAHAAGPRAPPTATPRMKAKAKRKTRKRKRGKGAGGDLSLLVRGLDKRTDIRNADIRKGLDDTSDLQLVRLAPAKRLQIDVSETPATFSSMRLRLQRFSVAAYMDAPWMMSGRGAEMLKKNLARRKHAARDAPEVEVARDATSNADARLSLGVPADSENDTIKMNVSQFDEVPVPNDGDFAEEFSNNPDEFYNDVDDINVNVSDGDISVRKSLGSLTLPTESVDASGTTRHKWNKRTVAMMQFLKDQLESAESITYQSLAQGRSRRTVAGCFFEILQLKTLNRIDVDQPGGSYADINITRGPSFEDSVPLTS